jgi:lipopolysaccharide export system permease protein
MIIERYLAREIFMAVGFVLLILLSLFFFIDFLSEIKSVGQGQYRTLHAALYVLLEAPANAYQLMPIAALIGTIYALAQFAANSEFTIVRMSGLSTATAAWNMIKVGAVMAILTFILGEYVMPQTQQYAEKMKYAQLGSNAPLVLRSGFWIKDIPVSPSGVTTGQRFVNATQVLPDGSLQEVRVYELDSLSRLTALAHADSAIYHENTGWQLKNVTETRFISPLASATETTKHPPLEKTEVIHATTRQWPARIDSNALTAAFVDPARMSALSLWRYQQHLSRTGQQSVKHQYALWRKVGYPLAVIVMLLLALPFAYLHTRSGGVSFKIFSGVMVGIVFYLMDSLTQHLGILNGWPGLSTFVPAILALTIAAAWLRWVSRH